MDSNMCIHRSNSATWWVICCNRNSGKELNNLSSLIAFRSNLPAKEKQQDLKALMRKLDLVCYRRELCGILQTKTCQEFHRIQHHHKFLGNVL